MILFSYPSLTEMEAQWGKLSADPDYAAAIEEVEKDEPAFYRVESTLLHSTAFCPALAATPAGAPPHKLYELRIYESPTNRQLGYLHDRFAGGEIDVFHRVVSIPYCTRTRCLGPTSPIWLISSRSKAKLNAKRHGQRLAPILTGSGFATNQSGTAARLCATLPTCFFRRQASRCFDEELKLSAAPSQSATWNKSFTGTSQKGETSFFPA